MQLRHFLLHGKIADHPIIFRLYLMLFDDRIGQRGILHLCGQIQQLLDLCAFACIVGINGFCPLASGSFSALSYRAPRL